MVEVGWFFERQSCTGREGVLALEVAEWWAAVDGCPTERALGRAYEAVELLY